MLSPVGIPMPCVGPSWGTHPCQYHPWGTLCLLANSSSKNIASRKKNIFNAGCAAVYGAGRTDVKSCCLLVPLVWKIKKISVEIGKGVKIGKERQAWGRTEGTTQHRRKRFSFFRDSVVEQPYGALLHSLAVTDNALRLRKWHFLPRVAPIYSRTS